MSVRFIWRFGPVDFEPLHVFFPPHLPESQSFHLFIYFILFGYCLCAYRLTKQMKTIYLERVLL